MVFILLSAQAPSHYPTLYSCLRLEIWKTRQPGCFFFSVGSVAFCCCCFKSTNGFETRVRYNLFSGFLGFVNAAREASGDRGIRTQCEAFRVWRSGNVWVVRCTRVFVRGGGGVDAWFYRERKPSFENCSWLRFVPLLRTDDGEAGRMSTKSFFLFFLFVIFSFKRTNLDERNDLDCKARLCFLSAEEQQFFYLI